MQKLGDILVLFWPPSMAVSSRGCNPRIALSSYYHLCPEINVNRFMVNFDKSLSVNHLVLTLGLAFLFRLAFRLGLGWLYVSLRRRVSRTLYDLHLTYFLPEVIMKFTRKARTLCETYLSRHASDLVHFFRHNILYANQYHFVYMLYMFIILFLLLWFFHFAVRLFDARQKMVDSANVTFTTTAPCVCATGCGCSVSKNIGQHLG